MNIIITYKGDKAFINIKTERFDSEKANEVKTTVFNIIDDGISKIILNLSAIEFIDSTGLGVIVSIFKKVTSINGELMLSPLSKQPKDLLNIIQLDKLLTFISIDEYKTLKVN